MISRGLNSNTRAHSRSAGLTVGHEYIKSASSRLLNPLQLAATIRCGQLGLRT